MIRTIRSEFIKLRTTNLWWLLGLGLLVSAALAITVNILLAHFELIHLPQPTNVPEADKAEIIAQEEARYAAAHSVASLVKTAANIATSGQTLGLLLVMVLGTLIITNEFRHQTATPTFLATPRRTVVVIAKLTVASVCAVAAWVLSTALSVPSGVVFLNLKHVTNVFGRWEVTQAVLLNLAAYLVWATIGMGLGALIRSQIGAVVTGLVAYLISGAAVTAVVMLANHWIKQDWVLALQVLAPSHASTVMITPGGQAFEHAPAQWVGALVLIGYGLVAGLIGTLILRHRDIT